MKIRIIKFKELQSRHIFYTKTPLRQNHMGDSAVEPGAVVGK